MKGTRASRRQAPRRAVLASAGILLLALPPLRATLEASMTLQMLVQIPLLAWLGWWLAGTLPVRLHQRVASWNAGGVSGLVLASMAALFWMLPLALDASVDRPWAAAAKFASVPLLVGLPLGLSWPQMGFVVRGLFLLEAVASCFRLGWLYLAAPDRLCSNYLLEDQQRLGWLLLALGAGMLLWLGGKLMFGHPASLPGVEPRPGPGCRALANARRP